MIIVTSKIGNKRLTLITMIMGLIMLLAINGQQYQLPPIWSQWQQNLRMYQIREVNQPDIQLDRVYKREVYKVNQPYTDSKNTTLIDDFSVCKQSSPEISFKNIGYYGLEQPTSIYSIDSQVVTINNTNISNSSNEQQQSINKKTTSIIYDYDVLKNKYINIIDMVHNQGSIFTISSTANFSVYSLTNDDNGIQLRSNLKGIDWEELYKYRYQSWLRLQNREKKRQDLIREMNKSNDGTIDSSSKNSTNGTQNNTIASTNNDNNPSQQNNSTATNPPTTRTLQQITSPKVFSNNNQSSIDKSSQQSSPSANNQNSTNAQQIYYTGPPPPFPKAHLQKGYFQFMNYNKLLIFVNNQYLIAYDIEKNWCFLLSEQLNYDYLFTKQQNGQNQQNQNNQSNSTDANGKTNINNESSKTNSSADDSQQKTSPFSQPQSQSSKNTTQPQPQQQVPKQTSIPDPQPIILPEFTQMKQFQQITKINQTHFAVIDKRSGVFIYRISQQKPQKFKSYSNNPSNYFLKKTAFLGKEQFGKLFDQSQSLNLADIVFYKNKSLLLVLDYEKGVFAFQQQLPIIVSNNESATNNNNTKNQSTTPNPINNTLPSPTIPQQSDFTLSSYRIIKKMCNLMQFSQPSQQLYLSCNKIYRISLKSWPKITQKTYPHPLINIREIYIQEEMDIIILSGYSVFKVMYLDRTANYFQDDMLDKIVFYKDCVITANEKHIIALKYKIEKPAITCQAQNRSLLGMHNILLRTTAECNSDYLKSVNYTITENKTFDQDDVCIYNVYKTVYIWQQGEVPLKPLAIVMLVFLIFISVMIIWYILIKFRMRRAQQHLMYLSEQGEEGHKTLVEEQNPNKQLTQQQQQNSQSDPYSSIKRSPIPTIRPDQQNHNKHLYSIE